ncbi:MAG: metal ABC transporter ATP-binding protein [Rhodospirillaceae bacterium]|nr:metal ABC transporter ATP-binding protein [Rhodospirillaceae bacterium]
MASLIELLGVGVVRDGKTILDHVDVTVGDGEIVTLIGPNGAGKSSLVKVALGLERNDTGRVTRREGLRVGYLPQRFAVDQALPITVRRILTLTLSADEARLRAALAEVGVEDLIDESIHTLSGGELQRVMLARALLREPHLLVLDEPTQNLDVGGAVECYQIIQRIRDRTGCGVLLVSHDLSIVMAATTRVYCLNAHVCCSGHPDDVSRDPEFLRLFGPAGAGTLALYKHTHDHSHTPHGEVVHEHHHHDHGHDHAGHDHAHHDHGGHR